MTQEICSPLISMWSEYGRLTFPMLSEMDSSSWIVQHVWADMEIIAAASAASVVRKRFIMF